MRILSIWLYAWAFTAVANAQINDDCASALPIITTTLVDAATISNNASHPSWTFPATTTVATPSNLPIIFSDGSAEDDLWYYFVATQTSATIAVYSDINYDAVVEVYKGSCGNLVFINGDDYGVEQDWELINLGGLIVGETYYVRVFDYYTNSADYEGAFSIILVNEDLCGNNSNPLNVSVQSDAALGSFTAIISGGVPPYEWRWKDASGMTYSTTTVIGFNLGDLVYLSVMDGDSCWRYTYGYMAAPLIGVERTKAENSMLIYPNPARQVTNLVLQTPEALSLNIQIINIAGQILWQESVQSAGELQYQLPIANLPTGVYSVKVTSQYHVQAQSLIIQE